MNAMHSFHNHCFSLSFVRSFVCLPFELETVVFICNSLIASIWIHGERQRKREKKRWSISKWCDRWEVEKFQFQIINGNKSENGIVSHMYQKNQIHLDVISFSIIRAYLLTKPLSSTAAHSFTQKKKQSSNNDNNDYER